jgi:hypothetical protein
MASQLRQLAARIRSVTIADAVAAVAPEISAAAVADTQDRMRAGKQPDGSAQPPLKYSRESGNTGPPLVNTGRLLAGVTAVVEKATVKVVATGPGARRHQKTRPFVGLSAAGKVTIGRLVMVGLVRKLRGG